MSNAATAFYSGQRVNYIHRQPRFRPKSPHPQLRPPRAHILLLCLLFVSILWTRHADMISTVSSWTPANSRSPFAYAPVDVDNVMDFDGNSNSIDVSSHDANQKSHHGKEDPSNNRNEDQVNQRNSDTTKDSTTEPQHLPSDSAAKPEANNPPREDDARPSDRQQSLHSTSEEAKLEQDLHERKQEVEDLKKYLNFNDRTAINFMHFHKTGGVSFKTALHKFYDGKVKSNGQAVVVRDACYAREGVKQDGQPSFKLWRCDWEPLKEQDEESRNRHDFVFGHQFRERGVEDLLNRRDLRTFTVLRHPFDRKVSFFYHFFVRELGRKEEDISFDEIRNFLLFDKLAVQADLGRDLGPNYMAGRLLSDGIDGYKGNKSYSHYAVDDEERAQIVERSLDLIRDYVFVGLQSQSAASQCMLRKVMEEFNAVNGVSNDGIEEVDKGGVRLNSGSYSLSAKVIWSKFTAEDRALFDRKEGVDLSIFREGERLFRKHVDIFRCSHRLAEDK